MGYTIYLWCRRDMDTLGKTANGWWNKMHWHSCDITVIPAYILSLSSPVPPRMFPWVFVVGPPLPRLETNMGDQKEAPVVPAISYEDGISTIRISSKDLPQRPQIDHVIKSSTIPRKPPGEAPSMPLEGATQSSSSLTSTDPVIINGPSVGSIRVSTLDRPKGVSKPSTFEPLSSPAKSSSTERLTAPESVAPVSSLEMINPSFDEPVQSTPASTPASIIIPRVNIKNDKKTPVHKDSNGSIPKETPKGLSTVSEEGSDDKDVTDDAKPVPPVVTPAPSALRKSSDEERAAKKNRKVSWNEHVVVTPDSTSEPSIIELQPEDHEYSPVGESSTPRQNAPNGDILHTGLDGEEFKGYDLLNTDPMFSLEESDNKQKWMLIVLFVLFIIVTIAAVVMGVLYGLRYGRNFNH